jgi:dephospho-CoA kinase
MHRPLKPRGPWANGPIPVIGIVGSIGAGKSVAAAQLASLGLHLLDADAVGHSLLTQRPTREAVVERFGTGILKPIEKDAEGTEIEPEIDRKVLGRLVFHDDRARRDLESILHPLMRKTFERAIGRAGRNGGAPGVALDAAILFEAGWNNLCDAVLFIDAPIDQRIARVAANRGWSPEDLAAREAAQDSISIKKNRADVLFTNDGEPEPFREAIGAWWKAFVPQNPGRQRPAPRSKPTEPRR